MLLLDFNSLFVRFSISLSLVSPCVSQVEYKFLIFALDAEAPRYCLASNECSSISQSCWGPPWTAGRPARHPRRTGLPGCGRRAGRPGGSKAGLGAAGGIPPLLKQLSFAARVPSLICEGRCSILPRPLRQCVAAAAAAARALQLTAGSCRDLARDQTAPR